MKLVNDESVVVIDIPRFCVPVEYAPEFIQKANDYFAGVRNLMLTYNGKNIVDYDTHYVNGEFIPLVKQFNSYSDVLNEHIRVTQVDKYVSVDTEEKLEYSAIEQLWNPKLVEEES